MRFLREASFWRMNRCPRVSSAVCVPLPSSEVGSHGREFLIWRREKCKVKVKELPVDNPLRTRSWPLLKRDKGQPLELWLFTECLPERTWVFEVFFISWKADILGCSEHWIKDSFCKEKGVVSYPCPGNLLKPSGLTPQAAPFRCRPWTVKQSSFCVCLGPLRTKMEKAALYHVKTIFHFLQHGSPTLDFFSETLRRSTALGGVSGVETDHIPRKWFWEAETIHFTCSHRGHLFSVITTKLCIPGLFSAA